uniref:Uncharacterized protein n=1 Tax=Curvibacter symbiont subsp. Hydra magnipapillata TaxID=667019 RepID=C9YGS1_CURXX|nr:hypothetical protein Csp_B19710 [Curvibacter putative symbiont of Hydra magnipapillata]
MGLTSAPKKQAVQKHSLAGSKTCGKGYSQSGKLACVTQVG